MEEKVRGILLGTVKHSDRANVVTFYTRERGRMAVVSPIGTGRAARIRAARLQLLSVVEASVKMKTGRELPILGESSTFKVWHTLYFDPAKCSLVFFLSEFLNRFLRDAPADSEMWDYVYGQLQRLDNLKSGIGNFHLQFLYGVIEKGGIMPDRGSWQPGMQLDYRSGEFVEMRRSNSVGLNVEESAYAAKILRLGSRGIGRLKMGRQQRTRILRAMLDYIDMHYPGTGNLSSLEILREIF